MGKVLAPLALFKRSFKKFKVLVKENLDMPVDFQTVNAALQPLEVLLLFIDIK